MSMSGPFGDIKGYCAVVNNQGFDPTHYVSTVCRVDRGLAGNAAQDQLLGRINEGLALLGVLGCYTIVPISPDDVALARRGLTERKERLLDGTLLHLDTSPRPIR